MEARLCTLRGPLRNHAAALQLGALAPWEMRNVTTQGPSSYAEESLQTLLGQNIECTSVVGMGPDVWELAQQLAPRLGPRGTYIGVHIDPDAVCEARRRLGDRSPEDAQVDFHEVTDNLRLSKSAADALVASQAPATLDGLEAVERELARLREEQPLVADDSADLVVATGLRFLASPVLRARIVQEFHRVLKRSGRLMVIDLVSDEAISAGRFDADANQELGQSPVPCCDLLDSLATAGFYGIELLRRDAEPWRESDGVEFRRVAVAAHKGKEGPCWEHFQAVMYRGPFRNVEDDDGHVYERGQQTAVCKKTFDILRRAPYSSAFEYTEPRTPIAAGEARPFPCNLPSAVRDPSQLKRGRRQSDTPGSGDSFGAPSDDHMDGHKNGKRKNLTVFTRSETDATGPAHEFGRFLSEQFANELEVRVVDLATQDDAPVPAQLRFRMSVSGDACLPALVLDGIVVTLGALPGRDEVRKLVAEGRPLGALPFNKLEPLSAQAGDCDAPGCC